MRNTPSYGLKKHVPDKHAVHPEHVAHVCATQQHPWLVLLCIAFLPVPLGYLAWGGALILHQK